LGPVISCHKQAENAVSLKEELEIVSWSLPLNVPAKNGFSYLLSPFSKVLGSVS